MTARTSATPKRALGRMLASACSNTRRRLKTSGVITSSSVFLSTSWRACFKSRSAEESLRPPRPMSVSSRRAARVLSVSRMKNATAPTSPATARNARSASITGFMLSSPCCQFGREPGGRSRRASPRAYANHSSRTAPPNSATVKTSIALQDALGAHVRRQLDPIRLQPLDDRRSHARRLDLAVGPAVSLDVRRPCLQTHHVVLLQLQLGRVLDRHHPLVGRNETGQRIEQRRLSATGAPGDHDVEAGLDRSLH